MNFNINSFEYKIICQGECEDAVFEAADRENELDIFISADKSRPEFVELSWSADDDKGLFVLGDAWERSYGELELLPLCENNRSMPWYFIATDRKRSFCFGVKTGANSFVSFRYNSDKITALIDCRNGGSGVHLNGRRVKLATFVFSEYNSGNVTECLKDYCRRLCEKPVLPEKRVYGGNNWYYAYGKSSFRQIVKDARLQAELSEGIENRPFQVVDDCWQIHRCEGPWYPNRKFKDMKKLADEIRACGVRPGIWVRLLHNRDRSLTKEMRILRKGKRRYLDPTHPEVQKYIRADIERIRSWGYELIKHDFSTADLFGSYGSELDDRITKIDGWHFYDKTKTNAEIVLDFYRLILEAAGDMLIIGCNTISHLSAGYVHISRTGDDTSGREWDRTRKMGVNTLAFRLAQNEAFYMCDADCVGILKKKIPWEKNSQWLDLLSKSNTPLFISCTDDIDEIKRADIRRAYKIFNEPHSIEPIDIFETKIPTEWKIDEKTVKYSW